MLSNSKYTVAKKENGFFGVVRVYPTPSGQINGNFETEAEAWDAIDASERANYAGVSDPSQY